LFRTGNVFLSQNGQRGSFLVFYIGYILDDKNTLCNGCFLTRLSVLFRVFKYGQCLMSCHVYGHKFLEDANEDSVQNPRQKQLVPVQLSGRAFEGIRTPLSVQQITMKTPGH
jgi:hypothetical protein